MATPLGQMCPRDSGSCGVAAHAGDGPVAEGQLEAADRLAQVADPDAVLGGGGHDRILTRRASTLMSSELLVLMSEPWSLSPAAPCWPRPPPAPPWPGRAPSRSRPGPRETRSSSPCRRSGSSTTAPTPRCAGSRYAARTTSPGPRASSCATTPGRPSIDPATWRLDLRGDGVDTATVACRSPTSRRSRAPGPRRPSSAPATAGRSSAPSRAEPAAGTPWRLGAVGAVTWEGVRLGEVLDRAGLRRDAVSIMATGLDPSYVSGGVDYGAVRRPFPVAKALDDALLAWGMNGEPLLPDHGAPAAAGAARAGSGSRASSGSGRSRSPGPSSPRRGTPSGTG